MTDSLWAFDRPVARRSLILCASGAVIGLGIAGFGLFTAKGTRISVVPAEDVAIVNQVPLLVSDYIAQLQALYSVSLSQATPAQKQRVLDDMIREELYVQRGVELGMQADTIEVRSALVGAVEAQVSADAATALPADADLRAWFAAHGDRYASEGQMELADYILPSGQSPAEAVAALRAAGPTSTTLSHFSLRSSGKMEDGAEFYFAAQIHLGDTLSSMARRLRDGEVSDPIIEPDGVHVLVMHHNVPPVPARFDDVRDKVLADYTADQAKRLTTANDEFLRKRADILIATGFE